MNLYEQLLVVRNKLKKKHSADARTPNICSDEALRELARLAPKHKEDMLNVQGLGKAFVEKYGDEFFDVLQKYHQENSTSLLMGKDVRHTLENFENRLVNISRGNRLLYSGKLVSKNMFDTYFAGNEKYNQEIKRLLDGKQKSIRLCDISTKAFMLEEQQKRYKKVLPLVREIEKDFRESGENNLYLAYPFVVGKVFNEDFDVRAPLMLFPVVATREADGITLRRNLDEDVLYNTNLILLHNKINNINSDLPNKVVEELTSNYEIEALKFFKENGIDIQNDMGEFEKFKEYSLKDFPQFKNGEYHLVNNVVLGKFALYSSAMQKDYRDMLKQKKISNLVNELLINAEDIDIYEDNFSVNTGKIEKFKEDNNFYINDLNTSQENALVKISNEEKLVIQGPPGTGKSQAITSIISDAVNKDKTVLMVSQKKAALDVIYSRLGTLSKYAILLNDVKDKDSFYNQLSNLIYLGKMQTFSNVNLQQTSKEIEKNIKELDLIKNAFCVNKNEASILNIYQENDNNRYKILHQKDFALFDIIDKNVFGLDYQILKRIRNKFDDENLLNNTTEYVSLITNYAWILDIKNDLNNYDKNVLINRLNEFCFSQKEYKKSFVLKRLFNHSKQKKALKQIFKQFFKSKNPQKLLFDSPNLIEEGLNEYDKILKLKPTYERLEDNEKDYVKSLAKLKKFGISEKEVNSCLFDFVVRNYIDDFESKNISSITGIEQFDKTVNQTISLINEKKQLVKDRTSVKLQECFNSYVSTSKRFGEIQRVVDSKRKWAIKKYLQKFDFELLKGIRIWLMTPEVVSEILPLEENLFDILIFDEASQIYIERGIPAISRAKKVVIAGDHKQLRPSSLGFGRMEEDDNEDEEDNPALEEESLLDLARFKYPEVMLNFHYRSKYEELINFSNYAFYKGKINVAPNVEALKNPPIEVFKVENGIWDKRKNLQEAKLVVKKIKEFFDTRKNNETIGIITFNVSQRDLILDLLDEECIKDEKFAVDYKKELERKQDGEDIGLFVKNIENVQGDERDYIIFSLAYAKNESGKVVRNFGWLNQRGGENRLNVAISRAKKKIIVITSISPEQLYVDDLQNEGPKFLRKYMEYCNSVSCGTNELTETLLKSLTNEEKYKLPQQDLPITNQIYDALVEKGYQVERNVGIGGYEIELALKKDDKYVLGIETDNKLYSSYFDTRDRDVHRTQYFSARNWKIYRIWSYNWWHDRQKVLDEIENIFKGE